MDALKRFAIHSAPRDKAFADAAAWLGRDARSGKPTVQPELDELPEATAEPRRYGFHGTIKPPFRLREGRATGRGKRRYFDNQAGAAIGIIRLKTELLPENRTVTEATI